MQTTTDTSDTKTLASDILLAILVNLKDLSGNEQLFFKVDSNRLQMTMDLLLHGYPELSHLKTKFVFSDYGPKPFSPQLQDALEHLLVSGMICWPDLQEPNLMRLNPSAETYYHQILRGSGTIKFSPNDVKASLEIAIKLKKFMSRFIFDRPYLINSKKIIAKHY